MQPIQVPTPDGRTLVAYDTGAGSGEVTLLWHHGSPQTGVPLEPVLEAARERGIRLLAYARPSYGGSTPQPGRDVAAAASDVAAVADALGVGELAVMGASGGGPHALACAASLPDRVWGVVTLAGIAPYTDDYDYFAGMADAGALRSALEGRAARAAYAEIEQFDPTVFTAEDWAALAGPWESLGADAQRASSDGPDGLVDDDVAFAGPWGFELSAVRAPVLLVQGGADRMVPASHASWLLEQLADAELWLRPRAGHVAILDALPLAMDWLRHLHR